MTRTTERSEVWLLTGTQHLYGEAIFATVDAHAKAIAQRLTDDPLSTMTVVAKPCLKTAEEILAACRAASTDPLCKGVICWMHTFSPAKMWIAGLKALSVPLCHLHTQAHQAIPWDSIDMDFMNLNQAAHGDREFGFMCTRLGLERKVVVGHVEAPATRQAVAAWMRAVGAWDAMKSLKLCRFGDNMRSVAVTDGDKVEAQMHLGLTVDGYGVGDLVRVIEGVSDAEAEALVRLYEDQYDLAPELRKGGGKAQNLLDAARIELGLRAFLDDGGYKAFTTTFEDLHGLKQLPGLAVQRLMHDGYGFGAEGDWKTSALVRTLKVLGQGEPGGTSFMEDYTYHMTADDTRVLGAHMLEVCPSLSRARPRCEAHPLGIGGKADPVRLVFDGDEGPAWTVSLVDLGHRFRMVAAAVDCVAPLQAMPRLPVGRVCWKPRPSLELSAAAWIYAGAGHHSVLTRTVTAERLADWASMANVELVTIDESTNVSTLRQMLKLSDAAYRAS
ncbi:MAG: L-arabinose isomerase [Myxococcales bacterium]|nr:L-arabinose isomerase [Myxococcales bacterium]